MDTHLNKWIPTLTGRDNRARCGNKCEPGFTLAMFTIYTSLPGSPHSPPRRTRTKTVFTNIFVYSCRIHTAANRTKRSHMIHTLSFVHVRGGMDTTRTDENFVNTVFVHVRLGGDPSNYPSPFNPLYLEILILLSLFCAYTTVGHFTRLTYFSQTFLRCSMNMVGHCHTIVPRLERLYFTRIHYWGWTTSVSTLRKS